MLNSNNYSFSVQGVAMNGDMSEPATISASTADCIFWNNKYKRQILKVFHCHWKCRRIAQFNEISQNVCTKSGGFTFPGNW